MGALHSASVLCLVVVAFEIETADAEQEPASAVKPSIKLINASDRFVVSVRLPGQMQHTEIKPKHELPLISVTGIEYYEGASWKQLPLNRPCEVRFSVSTDNATRTPIWYPEVKLTEEPPAESLSGPAISSPSAAPVPPRREVNQHEKRSLDGAWKLISYRPGTNEKPAIVPEGLQHLKLIIGGRYVSTLVDGDKAISFVAGRCECGKSRYREMADQVSNQDDLWMIGAPGEFSWRLEGNKLHVKGLVEGKEQEADIDEVWERLGSSGQRSLHEGAWDKTENDMLFGLLVVDGRFAWTVTHPQAPLMGGGGVFFSSEAGYSMRGLYAIPRDGFEWPRNTTSFRGTMSGDKWVQIYTYADGRQRTENWTRVK